MAVYIVTTKHALIQYSITLREHLYQLAAWTSACFLLAVGLWSITVASWFWTRKTHCATLQLAELTIDFSAGVPSTTTNFWCVYSLVKNGGKLQLLLARRGAPWIVIKHCQTQSNLPWYSVNCTAEFSCFSWSVKCPQYTGMPFSSTPLHTNLLSLRCC